MKKLIVTGDDFGLAEPVNEAIVEAHRHGILTTASLMVGAAAATDAVARARTVPSLKVGLHLVVVEGRPILAAEAVPDLVDLEGEFSRHLVRSGFKFFFRPAVRKQLEAEIRAQFEAFRETGFILDHVNAHNHMHLHPTILSLIIKVGREYGLQSIRFPYEPPLRSWRASRQGLSSKIGWWLFLAPWTKLMKKRLRRAGVHINDYLFGMANSGRMTLELVLALLREIPPGISEIYFHPATRRCPEIDRTMPNYQHEEEFKALTHPSVLEALKRNGIERVAFCDL
jgi:hopanoid biosynthesis associated protein HpnK